MLSHIFRANFLMVLFLLYLTVCPSCLHANQQDNEFTIINPVIKYPPTISVYILPLMSNSFDDEELIKYNKRLARALSESEDFIIQVYGLEKDKVKHVYKEGLIEDNKISSVIKIHPNYRYWKNINIDYLILYKFYVEQNKNKLEVKMYNIKKEIMVMGFKYTFNRLDMETLFKTSNKSIIDHLRKDYYPNK